MLNSQRKGKNYEREIAKRLSKAFGVRVKRVPQSGGIHDWISSDIHCIDPSILNQLHIECKHQQSLNFWKAWEKTRNLAYSSKIPIVVATKNFLDYDLVAIEFKDFINLVLEVEQLRKQIKEMEKI